jgi:hypothetical protein
LLCYASWESSRSPTVPRPREIFSFSSVGDVPNDGPSFLRFFSLNVEFVACVPLLMDG